MFVAASHCSKEDGYQHQLSSLAAHDLSRCLFKCSRMLSVSVQTGRPKRYNAQNILFSKLEHQTQLYCTVANYPLFGITL